ncbi:hypothetical protein MMC30_002453 [Trapelia coarctata]|nr:hypothetical protein [Trapelia coarctata]
MLKSTHRPLGGPPPLPSGWTEHTAPTGHSYYYHAETKQSTYTRPSASTPQAPTPVTGQSYENHGASNGQSHLSSLFTPQGSSLIQSQNIGAHGFHHGYLNQRRPIPEDRPKSKHLIPDCSPWLLIKTKLGRRFVYNPEEGQSFWKFPPDVMKGVIEYDRLEREKRERRERGEMSDDSEKPIEKPGSGEGTAPTAEPMPTMQATNRTTHDDESDEYEEVEVTDDEDDSPSKRQRLEAGDEEGTLEFNEDDMAYQLAAMGQEYGLDPGEYDDGQGDDWEEGAEGLPLTEEDSAALFKEMLNDLHVDPYAPWEKLIEEGKIIEDERYTCLPNMKSRKEVWGEWSRERIQRLKEQRERQEKGDPRIPYFAFLQKYATPKLYWPEFRRKYKKEPDMRDTKIADKDREKWYREYITRLKLPESQLKSDLTTLLKSLPLQAINRSTSLEALPPFLLTDIRYISLRPTVRDPLIETYIAISPPAPTLSGDSAEEEAELARQRSERERRERALAERAKQVQEEKRKQQGALRYSKDALREGEEEIQRAMRVGREGLLSHMEVDEQLKSTQTGMADPQIDPR